MSVPHGTMRVLVQPAALALALALLAAQGVDASEPEAAVDRVYCYFDPSAPDQVDRAAGIRALTRGLPGVEWIAVTPFPARVPEMTTVSLGELLSDPTRPRSVVPWLLARRAASSDHLLVERRGMTFSGPGTKALQVIAEAGLSQGPGPSTDVDVTTWGKVKDLFQ